MQEERSVRKRAAGYIVLILAAMLIVLGWRAGIANQGDQVGEAAISGEVARDGVVDSGESTSTEALPVVDVPVLLDVALSPASVPLTFVGHKPEHELQIYRVERGDTPNGIAEKFGIQAPTLLGGNPLISQESNLLQTGVDLIILPIDGVLHDVQPGDSLESISEQYGIPVEDIIAYEPNNLEFPYRLYPETQILVPGAVREVFVWTPPSLESVTGRSSFGGVTPVIVGTGTYLYPVGSRNFSQYFWYGHPGVDIALPEGTGVVASDTGTVTFAGWNIYGFGNLVVINHGNGFETLYAHLSSIGVVPGQIVYQGNVIGRTGNTGNSSGPHIHFEVRANGIQDNPCWYLGGC